MAVSDPQRSCAGCGAVRLKKDLVRIVASPQGWAVPDLKGNLPGRGAYVCPSFACIHRAAKGRLAAALRTPDLKGNAPEELIGAISRGMRSRALGLLGLGQRSRRLVSGTNLVRSELRGGGEPGWAAVVAEDASEQAIASAARGIEKAGVAMVRIFTRDEIGSAVGKSPRSVVLVKDRELAAALIRAAVRIQDVRSDGGKL